jgi:MoaA/NifB/PqqE/SkfB family radical SAM enzyme
MTLPTEFIRYLPPELQGLSWRAFPQDGKLLLFDRGTGLNVLLEGDETAHFRQIAPRSLLIAVTNACNLTCDFCYRSKQAHSLWTYDSLLRFCQEADEWGVLEVAFGGGEPLLFPRWDDLITELYETTHLSINFTTNGMHLTEDFLQSIAGKYGQIRLSLYEDNQWRDTIPLFAQAGARFGVNWMITPATLPRIDEDFIHLLDMGVSDVLLISYKGSDESLRLNNTERAIFADFVNRAYENFGSLAQLKLDACWGPTLPDVPRLFIEDDCGAGFGVLSITPDQIVKPCSFHHVHAAFQTLDEVREFWNEQHARRDPTCIGGCSRPGGC